MRIPLPALLATLASVSLGLVGLADMTGAAEAIFSDGALSEKIAPALAFAIFGIIVAAAELSNASLLVWAAERDREENAAHVARAARGLFACVIVLSALLAHEGIKSAERMFVAPIVASLESDLREAEASAAQALAAEEAARARENLPVETIAAAIRESSSRWERADLIARQAEAARVAAANLAPYEAHTAQARAAEARARVARAGAPVGFASLEVFGAQPIPWLIALLLALLQSGVAWIAAPRPKRKEARAVLHSDVLALDPAGLELISDLAELEAIRTAHKSLGAKADHVCRQRRIASRVK